MKNGNSCVISTEVSVFSKTLASLIVQLLTRACEQQSTEAKLVSTRMRKSKPNIHHSPGLAKYIYLLTLLFRSIFWLEECSQLHRRCFMVESVSERSTKEIYEPSEASPLAHYLESPSLWWIVIQSDYVIWCSSRLSTFLIFMFKFVIHVMFCTLTFREFI